MEECKVKKRWTSLEEAAQSARGSVLSVEERRSVVKKERSSGRLKAGGRRGQEGREAW